MILDFHTHIFPDALASKVIPTLSGRSGLSPTADGTADGLLRSMDEAGISRAVALSIATNAKQMHNVNSFALSLQGHSRLIPFGSVHPNGDWQYELDRLADGGIKGIKLHPDYQDFFIDDPDLQPIYEAILKKGFILLFHTGTDIGIPEPIHATPERIHHIMGLLRGEKAVLAHMGGFQQWDGVEQYLLGEDIYLDTSFTAGYIGEERMTAMLTRHRADRLLFATDCPWGSQHEEVQMMERLPLSQELKEQIYSKNACQLLAI